MSGISIKSAPSYEIATADLAVSRHKSINGRHYGIHFHSIYFENKIPYTVSNHHAHRHKWIVLRTYILWKHSSTVTNACFTNYDWLNFVSVELTAKLFIVILPICDKRGTVQCLMLNTFASSFAPTLFVVATEYSRQLGKYHSYWRSWGHRKHCRVHVRQADVDTRSTFPETFPSAISNDVVCLAKTN